MATMTSVSYDEWHQQAQTLAQSAEISLDEIRILLENSPLPLPDPALDQIDLIISNTSKYISMLPQLAQYLANLQKPAAKFTKLIRACIRASKWVEEYRQIHHLQHPHCYLLDHDLCFESLPPPVEQYNRNYCFWCLTGIILAHYEEHSSWVNNVIQAYINVLIFLRQTTPTTATTTTKTTITHSAPVPSLVHMAHDTDSSLHAHNANSTIPPLPSSAQKSLLPIHHASSHVLDENNPTQAQLPLFHHSHNTISPHNTYNTHGSHCTLNNNTLNNNTLNDNTLNDNTLDNNNTPHTNMNNSTNKTHYAHHNNNDANTHHNQTHNNTHTTNTHNNMHKNANIYTKNHNNNNNNNNNNINNNNNSTSKLPPIDDFLHRSLSTESAPILLSQSLQHLPPAKPTILISNNNNNTPIPISPSLSITPQLELKITHLEQQLEQKSAQCVQIETQYIDLMHQFEESQNICHATRLDLEQSKSYANKLQHDLNTIQPTLRNTSLQNDQFQREIQQLKNQIGEFQSQITQLERERERTGPSGPHKRPTGNLHEYGKAINDDPLVNIGPPPQKAGNSRAAQYQHEMDMKRYQDRLDAARAAQKQQQQQLQNRQTTGPKGGLAAPMSNNIGGGNSGGTQQLNANGEQQRTNIGPIPLLPDGSLPEALQGLEIPHIETVLGDMIDPAASGVTWEDVAGLNHCKQSITESLILPMLMPQAFNGLRDPPRGLLLFGPPGTGKTMLGKAIATQCKATFFCVSASSLTSKWYGQGEKMVKTLFAVCRFLSPCVLFIDEVDSMLTSRSEGEQEAGRRMKTEFLVQMDGIASQSKKQTLVEFKRQLELQSSGFSDGFRSLGNGSSITTNMTSVSTLTSIEDRIGLIVIAATNLPAQLDEAALRRFPKRLYVPLPGFLARKQLIYHLLSKQQDGYQCTDVQMSTIAKMTRGYSAADMTTLCKEAAMIAVREQFSNNDMTMKSNHKDRLSNPSNIMNPEFLLSIQFRQINANDLMYAAQNTVKPSVNQKTLNELWEYNSMHGSFAHLPREDEEEEQQEEEK